MQDDPMQSDLCRAVAALAGLPPAALYGVPPFDADSGEFLATLRKLTAARRKAGISGAAFRQMGRRELNDFCARFGFSRIEVQLARAFIEVPLAARRFRRVSHRLARIRLHRSDREHVLQ